MKLTCVLYTPTLGFTLISVGRIDDTGYFCTFGGGRCEIRTSDGHQIRYIPKSGGVYRSAHQSSRNTALAGVQQVSLQELHNQLGHIGTQTLKNLICNGIIDGIILTDNLDDFECRPCILGKTQRKSVPKICEGERAVEFSGEIHSDLWGPARTTTFGSQRYYISFTDDWSRWTTVYLLQQKSDSFDAYKAFVAWVETHLSKKIKVLHTDRGGEYLSIEFTASLDGKGTEQKLVVHDTPEENGVAERLNRTLIEKVQAMLLASQLPVRLWGEMLMHAVWLKNHTWTRALPRGVTPYELVVGDKLDITNVPEWGCVMWVHDTSTGKLGE
jgi:hypothetical protein